LQKSKNNSKRSNIEIIRSSNRHFNISVLLTKTNKAHFIISYKSKEIKIEKHSMGNKRKKRKSIEIVECPIDEFKYINPKKKRKGKLNKVFI